MARALTLRPRILRGRRYGDRMILDVMHAAKDAEPVDWWVSAQSPWWAAPVATLAGAVLAWFLARLTAGRARRAEEKRASEMLKRQTYVEFWSIALEHAHASAPVEADAQRAALMKAGESMLNIELVAPDSVQDAARKVFGMMASRSALDDERSNAMLALKEAIRGDLSIVKAKTK